MKTTALSLSSVVTLALLVGAPALAQQITGTPGSPGATTTIEGKQLPPPPGKFGGVIKENAKDFPTRAALITGRNHHSVGYGVIGEMSTGYPGYDSVIGVDNATIGTVLRDNGFATSWFGKNHNTPTYLYSPGGPFSQ